MEAEKIIKECASNGPFFDDDGKDILWDAVLSANNMLAKQLYNSIRYGLSYDKISEKEYIPISKSDFYGYRRLCIANYNDLLRLYRKWP